MTNIPIEWDKEFESKKAQEGTTRSSKYDLKVVYLAIKELKSQKGTKNLTMAQICQELAKKQKSGEIVYHCDLSTAKPNTVEHAFKKMKTLFENEEQKD